MQASTEVTRDKLVSDLKVVIGDAEELLRATASQAGEKVTVARQKIQESLDHAKRRMSEAGTVSAEQAKHAARATDEFVRQNPWQAVGIAAGVGLLLGLLIGRR
jgi:ElaB/YqjD/DUF883 family membrane-anchored ribosome-binding protein